MFRRLLVLIFLANAINVSGQIKNKLVKNDLELKKLKGPVKTILGKTYGVKYTSDSTYLLQDNNLLRWDGYKFEFDEKGYEKELLSFDSRLDNLKWIFRHDSKDRLIKKIALKLSDPVDTLFITTYKYKSDTLVLSETKMNTKKIQTEHKIIEDKEIIRTASEDGYETRRLYQYDKFNRLIRYEEYKDEEFIQRLQIYTYKDSLTDNVFKQVSIGPAYSEGQDGSYWIQEYGRYGNPVKKSVKRFQKNTIRESHRKYEYDAHGNWTRMENYFNNSNKINQVHTRKISYY